ncbi:MAG TPA: D-alanyl-D-alanine carboxypeptidase, partial [Ruminococcaceae bacterium]|nr:D-alanyl-D-alanine carboxypeptidase [Oscillospiraceae bacterium]
GMTHTHFVTPSGLDDDNHYSTASDMAKLACAAMKNETFATLV